MTRRKRLPSSWEWIQFHEILDEVIKVQPKQNPEEEFIYIDISSIDNAQNKIVSPKRYLGKDAPSRARQLILSEDILFSTVRTYLKNIAQVPLIYNGQIASTGFCVIRLSSPLDKKFFFYLILTDIFINPLSKIQRGTSYPAVRNSDVHEQYVPLPPLPEQKRIVAKIEELFTRLDAGVAELQKAKAQLKRYRQTVLKAAVEGELTREWREKHKDELETASEMLERILIERRAKWEEEELAKMRARGKKPKDDKWKQKYKEPEKPDIDGLPELPEGWEWIGVGQVAELRNGINFNKSQKGDKGILTIDVLNMYSNSLYIDFENLYRVDTNINDDLTLRRGDILFVRSSVKREGVGWAACFKEHKELVTFCGFIIRARLVSERIYPEFVTHCMRTSKARHDIISGSSQVTITNINQKALSKIVFPLTSLDEQKLIADKVERRLSIADEIERKLDEGMQRAERLRQSILKRAFEGKLVPQDTNDEPASSLLKRIEGERKQNQLEGKTREKVKKRAKKAEMNQLEFFKEENL